MAGARVAREAAKSFDVWVAGQSVLSEFGSSRWDKTSFEEARAAFRDQIEALVEGGVDPMTSNHARTLREVRST